MFGMVTLGKADPAGLKLSAHGWINMFIRATHAMSGLLSQLCDPTHEGATDTENMDVHEGIERGLRYIKSGGGNTVLMTMEVSMT